MIPILGTSHASIMILSPTRTRTGGSRRGFDEAAIARGRWPSGHRPRARTTGRQRQGKRKGSGGGARMHEGDRSTRSSRPPQVVVSESPTGPPEQSVFGYGAALTFQVESVETENASTPSRRRVGDHNRNVTRYRGCATNRRPLGFGVTFIWNVPARGTSRCARANANRCGAGGSTIAARAKLSSHRSPARRSAPVLAR